MALAAPVTRVGCNIPSGINNVGMPLTVSPATHGAQFQGTGAMTGAAAPAAAAQAAAAPLETAQSRIGAAQRTVDVTAAQLSAALTMRAPTPAPVAAPVAAAPRETTTAVPSGEVAAQEAYHEAEAKKVLETKLRTIPFRGTIVAKRANLLNGKETVETFQVPGAGSSHLAIKEIKAKIVNTHSAPIGVRFVGLDDAVPMSYGKASGASKAYHVMALPVAISGAPHTETCFTRKKEIEAYPLVHYGNTTEAKLRKEIKPDELTGEVRVPYQSTLTGMLVRKNPAVLNYAKKVIAQDGTEHFGFEKHNAHLLDSAVSAIMKKIDTPEHASSKIAADSFSIGVVPLKADGYEAFALQPVGADIDDHSEAAVTIDGEITAYVLE